MQEWKVSAPPVLEGEGRVVGLSAADRPPKEEFRASDPDLPQSRLRSTGGTPITQLRRLPDLTKAGAVTAGELMTALALTTHPNATLAQTARTMAPAWQDRAGRAGHTRVTDSALPAAIPPVPVEGDPLEPGTAVSISSTRSCRWVLTKAS